MDILALIQTITKENPYMATIIVDRSGSVVFINDAYLDFLELNREDVIGKDIRSITPHTRTVEVLKTGRELMYYDLTIKNDRHAGVACSVPIFKDGQIDGVLAYSMFNPFWDNRLKNRVRKSLKKKQTEEHYTARYNFGMILGEDEAFCKIKSLARKVAYHEDITVLLTGESGTGKELFAQAIHNFSKRSQYPFVRVNCAGIPENLLESELFGYEEGAYTGARKKGKPGKFEIANYGTIFLDEIGEMPLSMQSKLLIFLQEREIERLGGERPVRINVRVIAATNRSLEKMLEENTFREDLYYRLNVVRLEIPPLRSRKDDIPLLAEQLTKKMSNNLEMNICSVSPEALGVLMQHPWPGNVRELENILERAIILAGMDQSSIIKRKHIYFNNKSEFDEMTELHNLKDLVNEYEKKVITHILKETDNDKAEAAKYLGINPSSLYRKAKKYGISI